MNLCEVYSKKGNRRHLVDADKYKSVSKSKSLCGKTGRNYWIPDAVYFYGMNWKICKKCAKAKKHNKKGQP